METIYNYRKKLQNHGLIHGIMVYNVKSYKFCLSNPIIKLNKKRYIKSLSIYFFRKFESYSRMKKSNSKNKEIKNNKEIN